MKKINLNKNEMRVWEVLIIASEFQGHDFGFTDDVWREDVHTGRLLDPSEISKVQFGGYVSQIQAKGLIFCMTDDPDWANGFYLTQLGAEIAGVGKSYRENHPDRS